MSEGSTLARLIDQTFGGNGEYLVQLQQSLPTMDFQGQKLAERLMLYIICIAGLVAFCMGWFEGSFALMMKVRRIEVAPVSYILFKDTFGW